MQPTLINAGLGRRLAAILYDGLLLLGVVFAVTLVFIAVTGGGSTPASRLALQLVVVATVSGFFAWFWLHGGQTLGMRAWRLRLVGAHGEPVNRRQVLVRLLLAGGSWLAAGLGYLWLLVDRDHLTWHDRGSRTRVVLVPNKKSDQATRRSK